VIIVVPAPTAVTTPPGLVIVATPVLLLTQVCPPPDPSANVVVLPTHKVVVPVIGSSVFTSTVTVPVVVMPHASVTVRSYVVVTVGDTTTGVPAKGPGVHA